MTAITKQLQCYFPTWVHAHGATRSSRLPLRALEGVLALVVVAAAFVIWAQPDPTLDEELTQSVATKTRPGFSSDFNLAKTGEVIVSAYSGVPYTYPSDVTFKAPGKYDFTARDVEWIGEPFDNPIYYGVRIARWGPAARSGWMVDFTHSKAIGERSQTLKLDGTMGGKPAPQGKNIKEIFNKLEASHGHNMLTLNGLWRLPSWGLRMHPYVGLGAGVSLPHSEVHFVGNKKRTYEYQYTGPVAQGLFGLEFRFARTSYFLEYKFSFAPYDMPLSDRNGTLLIFDLWNQAQDWWHGKQPPGGRLATTFASHQVIGGLGVRIVPIPVTPAAAH